jgi:hypothetical protein
VKAINKGNKNPIGREILHAAKEGKSLRMFVKVLLMMAGSQGLKIHGCCQYRRKALYCQQAGLSIIVLNGIQKVLSAVRGNAKLKTFLLCTSAL